MIEHRDGRLAIGQAVRSAATFVHPVRRRDRADPVQKTGDAVDKSEQDLIRRYIGVLDIFATNRTNHTHFCEHWNIGTPGMAHVLKHGINPDAFFAMNRQFHETTAQLNKDLAGYVPEMAELAQRYSVPGGAFALLNPYNVDSREDARKAAKLLADEICARDAGGAGKPESQMAAAKSDAVATHSADFTTVNWYGTLYRFKKGNQAKAIECLWKEFEAGGHSLAEKTIGEAIGSDADDFRLAHVFRCKVPSKARGSRESKQADPMHSAWGKMIVKVSAGCFALARP